MGRFDGKGVASSVGIIASVLPQPESFPLPNNVLAMFRGGGGRTVAGQLVIKYLSEGSPAHGESHRVQRSLPGALVVAAEQCHFVWSIDNAVYSASYLAGVVPGYGGVA